MTGMVPNGAPPQLALRLLRAALDDAAAEPYVGDLLERFDDRAARGEAARARAAFWRDAAVALVRLPWRRRAAQRPGDPVLTATLTDLAHAARRLRRAPAFALLSALTLALGIGATTAVFSVAYTALLRPLPYPGADRLVDAAETQQGQPSTVSPPDFDDWRRQSRTLDLAAWIDPTGALAGDGPAEQIPIGMVTGTLFRVLGVAPSLGRAFNAAEAADGGPKAVVLSHRLWTRRYAADPRVVGRTIRLDGETREVVGVMPAGFDFPSHAELWVPLTFSADELATQRGAHYLRVLGRLRGQSTVAGANAELAGMAARMATMYPKSNTGAGAVVRSLRESTVGDARGALLVLLGAVGLLLLLACANVANLLLVRAARHERDRVVRAALGASRGQLARAVLSEALILATLGGLGGVAMAWWGTRALDATLRVARPRLAESHVDGPVLAFALVVSLATALAFGLLPAISAGRLREIASVLRGAAAGASGKGRLASGWRWGWRLRGSLVVAQVAITTLLLTGAALLGESFLRLRRVDLGFVPSGVWTFSVSLPDVRYPPARAAQFYASLIERVRATPGVRAVGATMGLPLSGVSYGITVRDLDGVLLDDATAPSTQVRVVTDDYFRAVGMRIVRGRGILPTDRRDAPPVVVVNETMARKMWPGQDPIGRRFTLGTRLGLGGDRVTGTVVGVSADVHGDAVQRDPRREVYFAHAQYPIGAMSFAVRGDLTPGLARTLAAHVAALDPEVPVYESRALDVLVADAVAEPRLYSLLLAAFAGTALVLAAVGVYGVVALAVGQRTRELGVRTALGARTADIVRLVVRQSTTPVAVGLVVGLAAALVSGRALAGLLFGVSATDPTTLVGVAAALAVVAALAVFVPTRRATRIAPTEALRDA